MVTPFVRDGAILPVSRDRVKNAHVGLEAASDRGVDMAEFPDALQKPVASRDIRNEMHAASLAPAHRLMTPLALQRLHAEPWSEARDLRTESRALVGPQRELRPDRAPAFPDIVSQQIVHQTQCVRVKLPSMTITSLPWHHPRPEQSQIRLQAVPEGVLHKLAMGESASLASQYVSPYLAGPDCIGLWRMRSQQIEERPSDAAWITRLIVDPDITVAVGAAGFHGAPDAAGMVELGYRVDPAFRRRGYARRSLETVLAVAQRHPDVRTVRATVSPDNAASLALIDSYGFVENGEQWDDEDGREIIFETPA
ncbi:GNAT family N-acetyltransferase [Curtobacterium sp. MCBD17_040]|uniref:GNAT family N-acetyltransferase n=1 Tax=Curtobacterium sp. MCBD17_040 TaxID=2175674 RepID=UPI0032E8A0E6